jgi:hypothetical protein
VAAIHACLSTCAMLGIARCGIARECPVGRARNCIMCDVTRHRSDWTSAGAVKRRWARMRVVLAFLLLSVVAAQAHDAQPTTTALTSLPPSPEAASATPVELQNGGGEEELQSLLHWAIGGCLLCPSSSVHERGVRTASRARATGSMCRTHSLSPPCSLNRALRPR